MTQREDRSLVSAQDALQADLTPLTDQQLADLFEEAERQQAGAYLLKCKVVATYRANHKQRCGASCIDLASAQFARGMRTVEAYANFWDLYSELDTETKERLPDLGSNHSLLQFIGRQARSKRLMALLATLDYTDGTGELPSVAAVSQLLLGDSQSGQDHSYIQSRLLLLSTKLGYTVWVADGDRKRVFRHTTPQDLRLMDALPALDPGNNDAQATVRLIDVIWLDSDTGGYVAAFEVEKTTAIYSGILRLSDLAAVAPNVNLRMFIVIPASRRGDVINQLNPPNFPEETARSTHALPHNHLHLPDF